MTTDKAGGLRQRARNMRDTIETYFIDDRGHLRYNINKNTMKPFTEDELAGMEVASVGSTTAGRWTYEDTMFLSGIYLWALSEEY